MVITWFGLGSFRIASGNLTVVTDPFSKTLGLTPPRVQTDVAVISDIKNPAANNWESLGGQNTFVIDGPGEYDVRGLFVHGIPANGAAIYSIRMEEIRLGFLGGLKQRELRDEQLEALGEIDILFVPIGGKQVCDAEGAVTMVNQIEPHFVIPMHFAQKGLNLNYDKAGLFLKEIGAGAQTLQEKFTIRKSEIGEQESQIVLLAPAR